MISILICTYNRNDLLRRAIASVLSQTYQDWEMFVIDDASIEHAVIPADPRIKLIRNKENQGREYGDRVHIKRFVNELATGEYFVYLCDDDAWIKPDLLETQIAYFDKNPNLSMAVGAQVSDFGDSQQHHDGVYPKELMTSDEFLAHFSNHPITCNIIVGATLFNREIFLRSGALQYAKGSQWQAGYEMLMAPGCYGDVAYINDPCIMVQINPENASFQKTQLDHYNDSVISLQDAFRSPLIDWHGTEREQFLIDIRTRTRHNISQAFLRNAEHIKAYGSLSMCSAKNISRPVTEADVITADVVLTGSGAITREYMDDARVIKQQEIDKHMLSEGPIDERRKP